MRVILTGFMILAIASAAQAVMTFEAVEATITPAALANDPTLVGARCWDVQVTSTYDIVGFSITAFTFDGGILYNHMFGQPHDVGEPNPAWVIGMPALAYDSYGNTPSAPLTVGIEPWDFLNLPVDYVDGVDDGPQTGFVMARITVLAPLGTGWMYMDYIEDDGIGNPISASVELPEPATMSLLALGGLAALRRRR